MNMVDKSIARSMLNATAQQLFDDITFSRVLGASRHTKMIGEMLLSIVDEMDNNCKKTVERVQTVADYFRETRGKNSRAIYNAINIMLGGKQLQMSTDAKDLCEQMHIRIDRFGKMSKENTDAAVSYGVALCKQWKTILIFDYSSTIDAFIRALDHPMTVVIPESRALDGGRPFVQNALMAGHTVKFIPDTTMMEALRSCDAAFTGAETIYPDGSVFNTIGTDVLGVLCKEMVIPLYIVSPLIKVDVRPVAGYTRLAPMPFDYGARLAEKWPQELRGKVDFSGIKLVKIPSQYITAIISEVGIVPPGAFFGVAMDYSRSLEGSEVIC